MKIQEEQQVQEEEVEEEFHERTVRASFKNGTEIREVQAVFYKDTGLGYTQTQSGKYQTMLEGGLTLCPYVLPSRWQIEEACRRIVPHVKLQAPSEIYATYEREHSGEKLGAFLKQVFFAVLDLDASSREVLPSPEEHLEALQDFVLERAGANTEHVPPLVF